MAKNSTKLMVCVLAAGLGLLALPQTALANIVTNPGFETGDFTGWTQGGDTSFTGVDHNPHSGTYAGFFGPATANGTLSQTLVTIPGSYSIDFWLENDDPAANNFFSVSFDGNVLDSMSNAAPFGYTEFTYTALASTSSTVLEFTFYNAASFWFLDDVSVDAVAAAPEPATLTLFGVGLVAMGALRRRKKSA